MRELSAAISTSRVTFPLVAAMKNVRKGHVRERTMRRLTDLREILRYVPRFRDKVFVIAIDGAIVEDDNFPNLLLDIALLRSLSIRVALVHGAAHQVRRFAKLSGVTPSDEIGTGVT